MIWMASNVTDPKRKKNRAGFVSNSAGHLVCHDYHRGKKTMILQGNFLIFLTRMWGFQEAVKFTLV